MKLDRKIIIKNIIMLSLKNICRDHIVYLFNQVDDIMKNKNSTSMKNKILVNAFFEPSTRTSLSFETAMYRLGGNVITFNENVSSIKKGESFEDTIKTLSTYGDIMVLRHPEIGAVEKASKISNIPIINAGDGSGQHPTQALLDLYTIYRTFPELKNLNILFIGDIEKSRTIHSLVEIFTLYPRNKLHFLAFNNCLPNEDILYNISLNHEQNIDDIIIQPDQLDISLYDVVYVTRLQKERHFSSVESNFILTPEMVSKMKEKSIIMHPLPRNKELPTTIDMDKRTVYFEQMKYGVYIRMALLEQLTN